MPGTEPLYRRSSGPVSYGPMGSSEQDIYPPLWLGLVRLAGKLAVILALAYGIHLLMNWATLRAAEAGNDHLMIGVFAVLLLAYALLIAVPFMPGIEVGISLLMLKGASIAPMVYSATVLGLILAFLAGRYMPYAWLHGFLADLRLKRAALLVERLEPMTLDERLAHLTEHVPGWLEPVVRTGRYLLLGLLFNIPGNGVLGGGGGIAFAAGFSRLFRPALTIAVIALAVLPVPLAVWLGGSGRLVP